MESAKMRIALLARWKDRYRNATNKLLLMVLNFILGKIIQGKDDDKTKQTVLEFIKLTEKYAKISVQLSDDWKKLEAEADAWEPPETT